jgi:hypothetical protein
VEPEGCLTISTRELHCARSMHKNVPKSLNFCNISAMRKAFNGEEQLAICEIFKLEEDPLLAVYNWLFFLIVTTLHMWT